MTLSVPTDPITRAVYRHILRTFAETGHPPSTEAIAAAVGLPDAAADRYLRIIEAADGLCRDPATGNILSAYPFSAAPTPHRVELGTGATVYALCVIDALGIPFLLDTDAVIHSACAHCGSGLTVRVVGGALSGVSPAETVVVCASAPADCYAATGQCPFINFFCSPTHAQAWRETHTGVRSALMDVAGAAACGRQVFAPLLR